MACACRHRRRCARVGRAIGAMRAQPTADGLWPAHADVVVLCSTFIMSGRSSSVKSSTEHGSTPTSRLAVAELGKVCMRQSWSAMVGRGRSWTARPSCARRHGRSAPPGRFWPSDEIRQHFRKVDISRDFGFSASEFFFVLWLAGKLCEPPNLVAPRIASRVQWSVSKGSVGGIEQS